MFPILIILLLTQTAYSLPVNLVANSYTDFLNFGEKKVYKAQPNDSKLDVLGNIFKQHVDLFKESDKLDMVFLVDASSSVGDQNFKSELKFIKKLLSDITVDFDHGRIAVVTFSSPSDTAKSIDDISKPSKDNNKCLLLNDQLMNVEYKGGETYTIGAFAKAKEIFHSSHRNAKKVIFLITDGYSNGEDPVPLSNELKKDHVTIFTIGIRNGNYKELYDISSKPGEFHSYLLDSFEEFEGLARRALHVDLSGGEYIPLGTSSPCDQLCDGSDCCDEHAVCTCGTTTGHYSCTCQSGYYGSGLKDDCIACSAGTYSDGPNSCILCPHSSHTTKPPANGVDSCFCKEGYQDDQNGGCKAIKCTKLEPPLNGYFIKECSDVVNSTCKVRCGVGYNLVGSRMRTCQNGSWSGEEPICQIRTCSKPPKIKHGLMKCENADLGLSYNESETNYPVDSVCKTTCDEGTQLIGSAERLCLTNARWDGTRTYCKPIKCKRLSPVKNAVIEPASCTAAKQIYGTICKIICNEGFQATGSTEKVCGENTLWEEKHYEKTICIDVTPPNLVCPQNITGTTVPGTNYGQVYWEEPNITDNSGLDVIMWINPAIHNVTKYKFKIGLNSVTYWAQDAFNNIISCNFVVEILDNEAPTIENCISPPPYLMSVGSTENITWDEPNIFDNSQTVNVTKTRHFGVFDVGTTIVTYTAMDASGNVNTCNITITTEESRCPPLEAPAFGRSDCKEVFDDIQCTVTCEEGYAIPLPDGASDESSRFLCRHEDALWYNSAGLQSPDCVVTVSANSSQDRGVEVVLEEDACNDTKRIEEIENEIKISLRKSLCAGDCEIDFDTECIEEDEEYTDMVEYRRKRETKIVGQETQSRKKHRKKKKKLNINFQINGQPLNETVGNDLKISGVNSTVKIKKTKASCPVGFIAKKNKCAQCPRGTFHEAKTNQCQSCDFGSYNDKVGQITCSKCPPFYSTRKMHVKSFSECRAMCPPGTYAKKKKIKLSAQGNHTVERATLSPYCRSCPVGAYQPDYGQIDCKLCPPGYITTKTHSTTIEDCIPSASEICKLDTTVCHHNGNCLVINEYEYSCQCFLGYIGSYCQTKLNPCQSQPCFNGASCADDKGDFTCKCMEGFSGQYCENVIEKEEACELLCFNGGTCVDVDGEPVCVCIAGFSGSNCEVKSKACDNVVCEHDGACLETRYSFKCKCTSGFMGRRCNILPCDYKPCKGNGICVNLAVDNATRADYRCICPGGYTGTNCLNRIDYCAKTPCRNGGTCANDLTTYICTCSKLFDGPNCEFTRKTDYMLRFSRYDINNFVRLNGFERNLTEITACLWVQSVDNFNYGTLFSYATRFTDNAFTLTDYTGLVLYVNKQYVVTDILLNDGYWHHVCVNWKSANGIYHIHVDGKLMKTGSELAAGTEIGAHGILIIGQEQDILGGRFSQSESFVGNMTYIDVWSRFLTVEEILEHQYDCSDRMLGDLYAWPEMQENIYGNVQRLSSTFCQGCEDHKPLYNGILEIIDNKTFYSCYEGFELSSKQFEKGRRCTKTSKWEGFYEPYCKKITCGYPGVVKNSYSTGKKYLYNDKITYHCYEGFTLQGSPTITCKGNGKWFPEKPICDGVHCKLPIIANGKIQIISEVGDHLDSSIVDLDTVITVSCYNNATFVGSPVATCLDDGSWDNVNMHCKQDTKIEEKRAIKQINCPTSRFPLVPENGYIDLDSIQKLKDQLSDFIEYKCKPGYKMEGSNISSCIVDGYWTEPSFACLST